EISIMTPLEELKKRLGNVVGNLEKGKVIATATELPAGGDPPPPVVNKDAGNNPFEAKFNKFGENSIAKSFITLAKDDKQFHHLGDDRVLENPRDFLRKRHPMDAPAAIRNKYVVADHELEAIIGTLLLKGVGKE